MKRSSLNKTKQRVYDVLSKSEKKGMSLNDILDTVFMLDQTNYNIDLIFSSLDLLLEDGYISFDVEKDLWKANV